jgi:hypothetical protein
MLSAPHGSSSLVPISTHPESVATHPLSKEPLLATIKKSASDGQVSQVGICRTNFYFLKTI